MVDFFSFTSTICKEKIEHCNQNPEFAKLRSSMLQAMCVINPQPIISNVPILCKSVLTLFNM